MKKATLSIGLLTLMMVLTSFTTPIDGAGGQSTGGNRKVDYIDIDGAGGQSTGGNRKVDFMGSTTSNQILNADIDGAGGQSTGGNRKVD